MMQNLALICKSDTSAPDSSVKINDFDYVSAVK